MAKTITIGPFNRVEGDLKIKVEIKGNKITDTQASGVMFRGFEKILKGRDPMDAIVFTCRICGICGIAHSIASSNALASVFDSKMPPNAYLIRNISLGIETLISHITHFYVFFAVDLTNKKYSKATNYKEILERFNQFNGTSFTKAVKARKNFVEILGFFVGKLPNTLVFQPGGVTKTINTNEIIRIKSILFNFKNFIEKNLLGSSIECWLNNKDISNLQKWLGKKEHENEDLGIFIKSCLDFGLDKLGKGPCKFLCFGNYNLPDGTTLVKSGYYDGTIKPFDQSKIKEHIKYSWFSGYEEGKNPLEGITEPLYDKPLAYSWAKAPRYDNEVVEVGPLARMIINKDPLISELFNKFGSCVYTRTLARLHEIVKLVREIDTWIEKINPGEPFYIKPNKKPDGEGIGLIEAPRGSLGHWVVIEKNRIKNYQVITPTAWNMSCRDSKDVPGVVEKALIGTFIGDEKNPVEIAHIIRSFDPCLVCTVH